MEVPYPVMYSFKDVVEKRARLDFIFLHLR